MRTDSRRDRLPLASRRTTVGYTQAELARAMGVDRGTVARWEQRATKPSPRFRRRLAELLHVSVFELAELLETPATGMAG
jgi:transcriptional regulator with XRE-family HTH domain